MEKEKIEIANAKWKIKKSKRGNKTVVIYINKMPSDKWCNSFYNYTDKNRYLDYCNLSFIEDDGVYLFIISNITQNDKLYYDDNIDSVIYDIIHEYIPNTNLKLNNNNITNALNLITNLKVGYYNSDDVSDYLLNNLESDLFTLAQTVTWLRHSVPSYDRCWGRGGYGWNKLTSNTHNKAKDLANKIALKKIMKLGKEKLSEFKVTKDTFKKLDKFDYYYSEFPDFNKLYNTVFDV